MIVLIACVVSLFEERVENAALSFFLLAAYLLLVLLNLFLLKVQHLHENSAGLLK